MAIPFTPVQIVGHDTLNPFGQSLAVGVPIVWQNHEMGRLHPGMIVDCDQDRFGVAIMNHLDYSIYQGRYSAFPSELINASGILPQTLIDSMKHDLREFIDYTPSDEKRAQTRYVLVMVRGKDEPSTTPYRHRKVLFTSIPGSTASHFERLERMLMEEHGLDITSTLFMSRSTKKWTWSEYRYRPSYCKDTDPGWVTNRDMTLPEKLHPTKRMADLNIMEYLNNFFEFEEFNEIARRECPDIIIPEVVV